MKTIGNYYSLHDTELRNNVEDLFKTQKLGKNIDKVKITRKLLNL